MNIFLIRIALLPLKTESCGDVNFVAIVGTDGCRYDNLRCQQWRKRQINSDFNERTDTHKRVWYYDYYIQICYVMAGLILGLRPSNERRCYFITASPIGWVQAWNQPWMGYWSFPIALNLVGIAVKFQSDMSILTINPTGSHHRPWNSLGQHKTLGFKI